MHFGVQLLNVFQCKYMTKMIGLFLILSNHMASKALKYSSVHIHLHSVERAVKNVPFLMANSHTVFEQQLRVNK